ncbi:uncharacterized protein LOC101235879 isoform X1 [Hydra vulgaris]|uniref:uncharacterized protein LOC101235879 isoform X1 n=1 Tax=Hydra vulgaris TaxID=6087 RepID=UPI001F5E528F|nr:uncharacterized protein LOC101235879 [Hydra vulgaris]
MMTVTSLICFIAIFSPFYASSNSNKVSKSIKKFEENIDNNKISNDGLLHDINIKSVDSPYTSESSILKNFFTHKNAAKIITKGFQNLQNLQEKSQILTPRSWKHAGRSVNLITRDGIDGPDGKESESLFQIPVTAEIVPLPPAPLPIVIRPAPLIQPSGIINYPDIIVTNNLVKTETLPANNVRLKSLEDSVQSLINKVDSGVLDHSGIDEINILIDVMNTLKSKIDLLDQSFEQNGGGIVEDSTNEAKQQQTNEYTDYTNSLLISEMNRFETVIRILSKKIDDLQLEIENRPTENDTSSLVRKITSSIASLQNMIVNISSKIDGKTNITKVLNSEKFQDTGGLVLPVKNLNDSMSFFGVKKNSSNIQKVNSKFDTQTGNLTKRLNDNQLEDSFRLLEAKVQSLEANFSIFQKQGKSKNVTHTEKIYLADKQKNLTEKATALNKSISLFTDTAKKLHEIPLFVSASPNLISSSLVVPLQPRQTVNSKYNQPNLVRDLFDVKLLKLLKKLLKSQADSLNKVKVVTTPKLNSASVSQLNTALVSQLDTQSSLIKNTSVMEADKSELPSSLFNQFYPFVSSNLYNDSLKQLISSLAQLKIDPVNNISSTKVSNSLVGLKLGLNILKTLSIAAPSCLNVLLPSLVTASQEKIKQLVKQLSLCSNGISEVNTRLDCKDLVPSCIHSFLNNSIKMSEKEGLQSPNKFEHDCKDLKECSGYHLTLLKVIKRNVDQFTETSNEKGQGSNLNASNSSVDGAEIKPISLDQNHSDESKNESIDSRFLEINNKNDYSVFGSSLTRQNSTESLIERISRIKEELKKQFTSPESSGDGEHSQSGKEKSFVIRPISLFKQANRTLDISSLNSLGIESPSTTIPIASVGPLNSLKSSDSSIDQSSYVDSLIRAIPNHKNETLYPKVVSESQDVYGQKSKLPDLQSPELHNLLVDVLNSKIGINTISPKVDDIGKLPDIKSTAEDALAKFKEDKYKNQIEELQRYLSIITKQDLNVVPKLDLSKNIVAPEMHLQNVGERVPGLSHIESENHASYSRHNGELEDSKEYRHHHKWEVDPSLLYEKYGQFHNHPKNRYRHHHEHSDYNYDEGAGNDDGSDDDDNETEVSQSNLDDVESNHGIEAENHRHKNYHDHNSYNKNHFFGAERRKINHHVYEPSNSLKYHSNKKSFQERFHENLRPMSEFRKHGNKWQFGPGPNHIAFPSRMSDDLHGKGSSLRPLYGMTTHEGEDDEDFNSPEEKYANDEYERPDVHPRDLPDQKNSRRGVRPWFVPSSRYLTNEYHHIRKSPLQFFHTHADSTEGEGHHYEFHQDNHDEYNHGAIRGFNHHYRLDHLLDTDHSHHEAFLHHDDEDLEIHHTDSGAVGDVDDNTEGEQRSFRDKNHRLKNHPFEKVYSKSTIDNKRWGGNRRHFTKYDCRGIRNCQMNEDENKVLDSLFSSPYFSMNDDHHDEYKDEQVSSLVGPYGHRKFLNDQQDITDKEERSLLASSANSLPIKEYTSKKFNNMDMFGRYRFIEKRSKTKFTNPRIIKNLLAKNLDQEPQLSANASSGGNPFGNTTKMLKTNLNNKLYKITKVNGTIAYLKKKTTREKNSIKGKKSIHKFYFYKTNSTILTNLEKRNKEKKKNISHRLKQSSMNNGVGKIVKVLVHSNQSKITIGFNNKTHNSLLAHKKHNSFGTIKSQRYKDYNNEEDKNEDFESHRIENHDENEKSSDWNHNEDMLPAGYLNAEHHGLYKKLDHEKGELLNLFDDVSEKNYGSEKMEERFLEKAIGLTNTLWGLNKRTNLSSHKEAVELKKRNDVDIKSQINVKENHVAVPKRNNFKMLKPENAFLPNEDDVLPIQYLSYEKNFINQRIGDENKAVKLLFERISRANNGNSEPEKIFLKKMIRLSGTDWKTGDIGRKYKLNFKRSNPGHLRRDKNLSLTKRFLKKTFRAPLKSKQNKKSNISKNIQKAKLDLSMQHNSSRNVAVKSIVKRHQSRLGYKKTDIMDEANWLMNKFQPTNKNENMYLSIVNDFNHMPSIIDKIEGKGPSEDIHEIGEGQGTQQHHHHLTYAKDSTNTIHSLNIQPHYDDSLKSRDSQKLAQTFVTEIGDDNQVTLSSKGKDTNLFTLGRIYPQKFSNQLTDDPSNQYIDENLDQSKITYSNTVNNQYGEKMQLSQYQNEASIDKLDQLNHKEHPIHISLNPGSISKKDYEYLTKNTPYLASNYPLSKTYNNEKQMIYGNIDKETMAPNSLMTNQLNEINLSEVPATEINFVPTPASELSLSPFLSKSFTEYNSFQAPSFERNLLPSSTSEVSSSNSHYSDPTLFNFPSEVKSFQVPVRKVNSHPVLSNSISEVNSFQVRANKANLPPASLTEGVSSLVLSNLKSERNINSQFFKRAYNNKYNIVALNKNQNEDFLKKVNKGEHSWLVKRKMKEKYLTKNQDSEAKQNTLKKNKHAKKGKNYKEKTGLYKPISIASVLDQDNSPSPKLLHRTNDWHSGHEKGTHTLGGDGHGGVLKKLGDDRTFDRGKTKEKEEDDEDEDEEDFENEDEFKEETKKEETYEHDHDDHENHSFKHQTYHEHHHDEDTGEGNERSHRHHQNDHHHRHDYDDDKNEDMMMQDRMGLDDRSTLQKEQNNDLLAEVIDKLSYRDSLIGSNLGILTVPAICKDEQCIIRDNFPIYNSKNYDHLKDQNAYGTGGLKKKVRNNDKRKFSLEEFNNLYKHKEYSSFYISNDKKFISPQTNLESFDITENIYPTTKHTDRVGKRRRKMRSVEVESLSGDNTSSNFTLNYTSTEKIDTVNVTNVSNNQTLYELNNSNTSESINFNIKPNYETITALKSKHIKNRPKRTRKRRKKKRIYKHKYKHHHKKAPSWDWSFSGDDDNSEDNVQNFDNDLHKKNRPKSYGKRTSRRKVQRKHFHKKHQDLNAEEKNYHFNKMKTQRGSDDLYNERADPEFDSSYISQNTQKIGNNSYDISPQSYYSVEDTSDKYAENPTDESLLNDGYYPGIRNQESFRKEYSNMPSEFLTEVNSSLLQSNLSGDKSGIPEKMHVFKSQKQKIYNNDQYRLLENQPTRLLDRLNEISNEALQKPQARFSSPQVIESGDEQQLLYFPNDLSTNSVNTPFDGSASIETGTNEYIQIKPNTVDFSKSQGTGYTRDTLNRNDKSEFSNFIYNNEPMNVPKVTDNEDMTTKYLHKVQTNDDTNQHDYSNVPEFDSKSLDSDYLSRLYPERIRKIEQQRFAEKVTKETKELSHLFDDIKLHDDKQPEEKFVGEVTHLVGTKWGLEGNMGYKVHYPHIRRNKNKEYRKLIVNLNEPGVPMDAPYSPPNNFQSLNDGHRRKSNDHDDENSHRRSIEWYLKKTRGKLSNFHRKSHPIINLNKNITKHKKSFHHKKPIIGNRNTSFTDQIINVKDDFKRKQIKLGILKKNVNIKKLVLKDRIKSFNFGKTTNKFQQENNFLQRAFKKSLDDAVLQTDEDNKPILTGLFSFKPPTLRGNVGKFKNSFKNESLKKYNTPYVHEDEDEDVDEMFKTGEHGFKKNQDFRDDKDYNTLDMQESKNTENENEVPFRAGNDIKNGQYKEKSYIHDGNYTHDQDEDDEENSKNDILLDHFKKHERFNYNKKDTPNIREAKIDIDETMYKTDKYRFLNKMKNHNLQPRHEKEDSIDFDEALHKPGKSFNKNKRLKDNEVDYNMPYKHERHTLKDANRTPYKTHKNERLNDETKGYNKLYKLEKENTKSIDESKHAYHEGKLRNKDQQYSYFPLDDHPAHYLFRHIARGGSVQNYDPQKSINEYLKNHDPNHVRHQFHYGLQKHHHLHKNHPNPFIKEDPLESSFFNSALNTFDSFRESNVNFKTVKRYKLTKHIDLNKSKINLRKPASQKTKNGSSKAFSSNLSLENKNKKDKRLDAVRNKTQNSSDYKKHAPTSDNNKQKGQTKTSELAKTSNSFKKNIIFRVKRSKTNIVKPQNNESDNDHLFFQTIGNESEDIPNIRETAVSSKLSSSTKLSDNYASFHQVKFEGSSDTPLEKSPSALKKVCKYVKESQLLTSEAKVPLKEENVPPFLTTPKPLKDLKLYQMLTSEQFEEKQDYYKKKPPKKMCKYIEESQLLTSEAKIPLKEENVPPFLTTPKPLKDLKLYQMLTSEELNEKPDSYKKKAKDFSDNDDSELLTSEGSPCHHYDQGDDEELAHPDKHPFSEAKNNTSAFFESLKLKKIFQLKSSTDSSLFKNSKSFQSLNDNKGYVSKYRLLKKLLNESSMIQDNDKDLLVEKPTLAPLNILHSSSKSHSLEESQKLKVLPMVSQDSPKENQFSSKNTSVVLGIKENTAIQDEQVVKNQSNFTNVKNKMDTDYKLTSFKTNTIDNEKNPKTEKYYETALKALKNIKLPSNQ